MRLIRNLAFVVTATLALLPGMAQAAETSCLTPLEFTALATYALPSVITGTSQRCAAALPADAFLTMQGPNIATRYSTAKPSSWPGAKAAFIKLTGATKPEAMDLLRTLPDPQLQHIADAAIAAKMSGTVPVERCGSIDRLLRLLSPLPPESTAEVIVLAAGLGAAVGQARIGRIAVCPA